jgi:hypothetical protein
MQIADWLEKLGLSEYAQRFAETQKRAWWVQAVSATPAANLAAGVTKPSVFLGRVLSLRAIHQFHQDRLESHPCQLAR